MTETDLTQNALVSVIMPVYNSVYTLERAFRSVQRQALEDWELLMVDDQSTDESWFLMKQLALEDNRLRILQLPANEGSGVARNKAISEAKGRFLAFLDADDEWLEKKLETQINWMLQKNIAFSCTSYRRARDGNTYKTVHVTDQVNRDQLLKNNTVGTLTAVYDTQQLGKIYMPEIRRRQDYALWLKILEKEAYVYGLPDVLSVYHSGHASLSSNKFSVIIDQWKFFRNFMGLSFYNSTRYFVSYLINSLKRNF